MPDLTSASPAAAAAGDALATHYGRFLAFLRTRLPDDAADDVLQDAFVRALPRLRSLRDGESSVAWFYRLLRRAVADYYRTRRRPGAALDPATPGPEPLERAACACVAAIADALPPAQAALIRAIDIDGRRPVELAAELGISANTASVRLLRARRALREQVLACCRACAPAGCAACACTGP